MRMHLGLKHTTFKMELYKFGGEIIMKKSKKLSFKGTLRERIIWRGIT